MHAVPSTDKKEVSLSGPTGVKKANLTAEQQLAVTEMKMQRLEALQKQLQDEIASLKQTNEQMEESNSSLTEQVNRLSEENQKVSNQLTEQKKTFDTQKKQLGKFFNLGPKTLKRAKFNTLNGKQIKEMNKLKRSSTKNKN